MADAQVKKFVFNNNTDQLYPLVLAAIKYIGQKVKLSDDTIPRLKMVLVELLTNSLKHAGVDETTIEVTPTDKEIVIKKTDNGNGLAIRINENLLEWPLPGVHHANKIITIYSDADGVLMAKLLNNCSLQFFIKETTEISPIDINNLPEHFGLMIITRASDTFSYHFDIESCFNSFIVNFFVK